MTIEPDFSALMRSAQAGDARAIERLYRSVAPIVRGFLFSSGARDVDDLLGDTMVSVLSKLATFDGSESDFRSWVLTIAYRRHVDSLRRWGRRPEDPFDPEVLTAWSGGERRGDRPGTRTGGRPSTRGSAGGDADRVALDRMAVDDLLAAVGRLTEAQRDVVMLRALADLTVPQIAEVLGRPETSVRSLLHRAAQRLRRTGSFPVAVADNR